MSTKWLEWAQRLQALAQNGLTYCKIPFEIERYEGVRQVAAEMMAAGSSLSSQAVVDLFAREEGYATPKIDVRAAVFREGRILLVKEKLDQGRWTLPGGWVDVGDSPSSAAVREVFEESGYETRAVKLLAVFDRNHPRHGHPPSRFHIYKLFFLCELVGGAPKDSHETEGASFFSETEIPELSLTRVVPSQIARLFEHHRNPDLPTDFD